jgi:hypothetical protein
VTTYESQIRAAIRATVIHSSTHHSWLGKSGRHLPPQICTALQPTTRRAYLLETLASRLYADFYIRGVPTPTRWEVPSSPARRAGFVQALSEANTGKGYWDGGWRIGELTGEYVKAQKDGLELTVPFEAWNSPDLTASDTDGSIRLRFPKEFLGLAPGFYLACGDNADTRVAGTIVRLYWNLQAAGAPLFVNAVTRGMNNAQVPFRLKVISDPALFTRCDAGILYLTREDFLSFFHVVRSLYQDVEKMLKPLVPALTKRLALGLGYAEDPGLDQSFGEHRCHILADGMIRAYEGGRRTMQQRWNEIKARVVEEGLDVECPYAQRAEDDITRGLAHALASG